MELGNDALIHEAVREQAGVPWLESLWQDVRYGVRILRRSWFNMDLVWAVSLVAAGLITMFS